MTGGQDLEVALRRGAAELFGLCKQLEAIEARLETFYHKAGHALVPEEIRALQDIDLVQQSAANLARYLERLASVGGHVPADVFDEAIASIQLSDLAQRLKEGSKHARTSDTIDLF